MIHSLKKTQEHGISNKQIYCYPQNIFKKENDDTLKNIKLNDKPHA